MNKSYAYLSTQLRHTASRLEQRLLIETPHIIVLLFGAAQAIDDLNGKENVVEEEEIMRIKVEGKTKVFRLVEVIDDPAK